MQLNTRFLFCYNVTMKNKTLYRTLNNRMLGGVCGGIAEYFTIDPSIIRIAFVLVTLFAGFVPGILLYVVLWIILPEKSTLSKSSKKELPEKKEEK